MKIEIEELPDTLSKEIRKLLRMVYEAGRAKGREEARREQQHLAKPANGTAQKSTAPSLPGKPARRGRRGGHFMPRLTRRKGPP